MNTVKPARSDIPRYGGDPDTPAIAPLIVATGIFNIIVPLFAALFAWAQAAAFVHTLRISNLIILTKVVLDLQYYVRKSTAPFVSTSAYAWLIALCGTVALLLLRPTDDESDFWLATGLQIIGGAMQIQVITTFKRSRGMVVARHGVRRDGLYCLVRHPLYLAFMFGQYGYVLNHTSFYNLCVLALVTLFQVLRIKEEERLLVKDEEFQAYAEQTPWRIIPGVF
jgi:protein-S-isoprenylcysteine O-methyltransferase Ste14